MLFAVIVNPLVDGCSFLVSTTPNMSNATRLAHANYYLKRRGPDHTSQLERDALASCVRRGPWPVLTFLGQQLTVRVDC